VEIRRVADLDFNRLLARRFHPSPDGPRTAWVTVDDGLHAEGARLTCGYSTDRAQEGQTLEVERRNGKAVRLTVPSVGLVVFA
jgi:hypothetical protein